LINTMKCCAILALSAGAYAAQDVTPPVVSLSLPTDANYDDRNCETESCTKSTKAKLNNMQSVTCEVNASDEKTACPEPTCAVYDHHDTTNLECTTTRILVNNDGVAVPTHNSTATDNVIDRGLRSEWLLTYSASDRAGNKAEEVSFTMIFRDTQRPVIDTPTFGESTAGHCDKTDTFTAPAFESCSEGGRTAPCTHDLGVGVTSDDGYDEDVSNNIYVSLKQGSNTVWARQKQEPRTSLDMDTRILGDWTLEYDSSDDAGIFGCGETSNKATYTISLNVQDTVKPVISPNEHAKTLQCGVDKYDEPGANCEDLRDQWDTAQKKYVTNELLHQPANAKTPGTITGSCGKFDLPSNADPLTCGFDATKATTSFDVVYTCKDENDNHADDVTRTVTIVDTKKPTIKLVGDDVIENSAGAQAEHDKTQFEHATNSLGKGLNLEKIGMVCADGPDGKCVGGATCTDECDSNPKMKAELFYGKCPLPGQTGGDSLGEVNNFPEYTSGDYHIVYTCTDGHGGTARTPLTSSICRTIQNVDHTLPIIQVLGSNVMTLEATHEGNYVDDGATCSDQVDGVISQNVEVSGDVVNLSKVGTYEITYNCKDSAGNAAPTMKRTVHVAQTSCPTCSIDGNNPQYHEASFAYTDAGVTCSDLIDGSITGQALPPVGPTGNAAKDSSTTTLALMPEHVGTYEITYKAKKLRWPVERREVPWHVEHIRPHCHCPGHPQARDPDQVQRCGGGPWRRRPKQHA